LLFYFIFDTLELILIFIDSFNSFGVFVFSREGVFREFPLPSFFSYTTMQGDIMKTTKLAVLMAVMLFAFSFTLSSCKNCNGNKGEEGEKERLDKKTKTEENKLRKELEKVAEEGVRVEVARTKWAVREGEKINVQIVLKKGIVEAAEEWARGLMKEMVREAARKTMRKAMGIWEEWVKEGKEVGFGHIDVKVVMKMKDMGGGGGRRLMWRHMWRGTQNVCEILQ
jgi:hypothetical protein